MLFLGAAGPRDDPGRGRGLASLSAWTRRLVLAASCLGSPARLKRLSRGGVLLNGVPVCMARPVRCPVGVCGHSRRLAVGTALCPGLAHVAGGSRGDFHVTRGEAPEPSSLVAAPAPSPRGAWDGSPPLASGGLWWVLLLLPECLPAPRAPRRPVGPPGASLFGGRA